MMSTKQENELLEIGRNSFAAIVEMVAALEVDYDRLQELREERDSFAESFNDAAEGRAQWVIDNPADAAELVALGNAAGECESREDAEQRIHEDPLCLEYRTGWIVADQWNSDSKSPGEFCLTLTTGGPAVRIIGEIESGEVDSARLEVQDWGTPWTEHRLTGEQNDTLLTYCRCFYFGE